MTLRVEPIYTCLKPESVSGKTAVVIDTLRMTSVAATTVYHGAKELKIVPTVEEALALRDENTLLGGERNAVKIPGFDLSNSPAEYTRERVAGKTVILTTTNGARAVNACKGAAHLYLACMMNASAAAEILSGADEAVIVLSGTNGHFSLEDAVTAGAIIARLPEYTEMDDMGMACRALYESAKGDIFGFLKDVFHVKRLQRLGYGNDVVTCLQEDTAPCVPEIWLSRVES